MFMLYRGSFSFINGPSFIISFISYLLIRITRIDAAIIIIGTPTSHAARLSFDKSRQRNFILRAPVNLSALARLMASQIDIINVRRGGNRANADVIVANMHGGK